MEECKHYKIIRYFRDNFKKRVIKKGLTLKEAQAHCQREDTKGDGWFDGFTNK
tara:strand:- start:43 stop:201 length:159 start_codon:yes stop_codon:yes gene_type:complete